jgi:AraC-like DNA-binding protein/mannose-6-phosphate isomerase-like protein (cupin superfamily)
MPFFLVFKAKILENDFIVNVGLRKRFVNSRNNVLVKTRPWGTYCFSSWTAGQSYRFHSHPYFQAIQTLEGQLEADYGKGWKPIDPGYVHVLPPGYKHRFRTTGVRQFGIEFTIEDDEMGLLAAVRRAFPVPIVLPMCFHASLEEILNKAFPLEDSARLRMLTALMDWTSSLIESKNKGKSDPEATRLVELLKTWSRRSISVADVAGKLYWSERKSQMICKRRFGCGIAQLHKKMRIEEASRLLLNSGLSVGEIADACGFDIYSFSRAFTRVTGVSPSAFRRKKEG